MKCIVSENITYFKHLETECSGQNEVFPVSQETEHWLESNTTLLRMAAAVPVYSDNLLH